ncbi:MAG: hypothetical protein RJQ09_00715 [Cyclobacteriaceae bacterium]
MKKLSEALDIVLLPRLVLIKDLTFEEGFKEDPTFDTGKFIAYSEDIFELRNQIPSPKYPEGKEQQELYKFKFGNDNPESAYYTDLPSDLFDDNPDSKIFGTSYTIVWLVPTDIDQTVASLVKRVKEGYTQEETVETYMDRMIVYPPDSLIDMKDPRVELGFMYAVQEEFTKKVEGA